MDAYLARFGNAAGGFVAAALAWSAPPDALLPSPWWRVLRANTEVDIGLRVTPGTETRTLLLLTADRAEAATLMIDALSAANPTGSLHAPVDAGEFNLLTRLPFGPDHLRVQHEGYQANGEPLGCDFRLYRAWVGQGLPEGVAYQVVLRPRPPDAERERRVRKYVARLELEQPYSPPVRELQCMLTRRLLATGWLADEYLLFSSAALRQAWQERIRTHFSETTGRLGFRDAPVESGDFSDWLTTGCHTARDGEGPASLPVEAASTFSEDEVAWLVRQSVLPGESGTTAARPDVFISYASGDFAVADAARQHLEGAGWRCWIAPRDINWGGLPYTEAIPRALQQVRAVVLVLSPAANLSVHIPREIDLALARRLPVLPLRLVDVAPTGQLDYLLRTCQWLDMFGKDRDEAMRELTSRLRGLGL